MAQTPRKYFIGCPPECSLHPDKIGKEAAEALLAFKEAGHGRGVWSRNAKEVLGREVAGGTASRHLLHYKEVDSARPEDLHDRETDGKVGDLVVLETIIQRGFANSKNWKPSIKDTLDAMALKAKLTGNSAFEDMLSMMSGALDDADAEVEAPEAVLSEAERPTEASADLVDG